MLMDIAATVGTTSVYLFLFLIVYAAINDLVDLTIPNWLIIAGIGLYVVAAAGYQIGWASFALGFATMLGVLTVTFVLFALKVMGGGDAKLLAVVSLWFGWGSDLYLFLTLTALAGGALAVLLLVLHRIPLPVWMYRLKGIPQFGQQRPDVAYGVAICAGALLTFFQSSWLI